MSARAHDWNPSWICNKFNSKFIIGIHAAFLIRVKLYICQKIIKNYFGCTDLFLSFQGKIKIKKICSFMHWFISYQHGNFSYWKKIFLFLLLLSFSFVLFFLLKITNVIFFFDFLFRTDKKRYLYWKRQ